MDVARPFGLSRDPFAPTVEPDEAFESRAFRAARDGVLRELGQGARLVAVVGAAGTGKSLLLRALEQRLAGKGKRVRRIDRGDLALGAVDADADILLIDEADRIDHDGLVALSDAAARPNHPALVLAAVKRRFDHLPGATMARTIGLDELTAADARELVIDRIRRAGGNPGLFTPGALSAITYVAGGSPRLLRLLSAGALFQASQDGAGRVEMGHARRAIAMQKGIAEDAAVPPKATAPEATPPEPVMPPVVAAAPVATAPTLIEVSPRAARHEEIAPTIETPSSERPIEPPPLAVPPEPLPADETPASPEPAERRWRRPAMAAALLAVLAGAASLPWLIDARDDVERPMTVRPSKAAPAPVAREANPPPSRVEEPAPAPSAPPAALPPAPASPSAAAPSPVPAVTPPEAAPTVVVNYARGQSGADEAAGRVADLLRARGYEVAEVRGLPGRIRQPSIRYGSVGSATAEAINQAFEQALRAYQPGITSRAMAADTPDGTVEVWVPDSAAVASRPLRIDAPPD